MAKEFLDLKVVRNNALKLAERIRNDGFIPDVIYVSLRGGAYLGNVISEYFKVVRNGERPVFYAAVVARLESIVGDIDPDVSAAQLFGQPAPAFEIGPDLRYPRRRSLVEFPQGDRADHAVSLQPDTLLKGSDRGLEGAVELVCIVFLRRQPFWRDIEV